MGLNATIYMDIYGQMAIICNCPTGIANDECGGAIEVTCGQTIEGSSVDATFDAAPFCVDTEHSGPSVWYHVDLAAPSTLTASTCLQADFDTQVTIWGGDCLGLECKAAVDDSQGCENTGVVAASLPAGRYYIMVDGFETSSGTFMLTISCGMPPALLVANLECLFFFCAHFFVALSF